MKGVKQILPVYSFHERKNTNFALHKTKQIHGLLYFREGNFMQMRSIKAHTRQEYNVTIVTYVTCFAYLYLNFTKCAQG